MKMINRLENGYVEFDKLSESEIDYIASSKVILNDYSYLLRNERDTPQFVAAAVQRACYIEDITAKNGVFVEINSMENFDPYNRPAFARGELCHPKHADKVIQDAEQSIRRLKAAAKEKNEIFPYSKCDLSIFSRKPEGGLDALHTSIVIGDKGQTGLTDHLNQCCKDGRLKEIFKAYSDALHDHIWDFHVIPKISGFEELRDNLSHADEKKIKNTAPQYEHSTIDKKPVIGSLGKKMDIGEGA